MTSTRRVRPVSRAGSVGAGVLLLLLAACGPAPGTAGGGEAAAPAVPGPASSASGSGSSGTRSVGPGSAGDDPSDPARPKPSPATRSREPAVSQYRATLPPRTPVRPAPARFAASSIDVDLPVVRTGVTEDGLMQLPETTQQVAWYGFGSRPGDPDGTTVLAGHVDTRADGLGPFARLRELRRGDALTVTDARGRTRRYTVTAVDDVQKSRISPDQLFRRDGPAELKVLTCGGPFSPRTGYRDNIVVTARPAS